MHWQFVAGVFLLFAAVPAVLVVTARWGANARRKWIESNAFVCRRCYRRFSTQVGSSPVGGCRRCGVEDRHLRWSGPIQAVIDLDPHASSAVVQRRDSLEVNWALVRAPFDFDSVCIRAATDRDMEEFVISLSNQLGAKSLRAVPVYVSSSCQLSENALAILRSTFTSVNCIE